MTDNAPRGDSTAAVGCVLGDCVEVLRGLPESSIDAVVTDPPYGIGFMGYAWDQPGEFGSQRGNGGQETRGGQWDRPRRTGPASRGSVAAGTYDLSPTGMRNFQGWCESWAREALRVLKPGGHLLSFASTRTNHRHVCGIEDAGFEIRDSLVWLFGSGFPKNRDLGDGRGTALKPGHEPITLARKPFKGSATANVAQHGTGGLNIDACRIPVEDDDYARNHSGDRGHAGTRSPDQDRSTDFSHGGGSAVAGARWPANVALDDEAAAMLDAQSGQLVSGANPTRRGSDKFRSVYGDFAGQEECEPQRGIDIGGASRFYYCAKASAAERHAGLGDDENDHPTVKPIDLMRWLIRLVTPPGGTVLDPFVGSGTTGCAAALEDRAFIGIDRDPHYIDIATRRIRYWTPQGFQIDLLGEGAAA